MKAGWEVKPLGEVAQVMLGNSAPQKKEAFEAGGLPFVRTADVGQIRFGSLFSTKDQITADAASNMTLHSAGSTLYPKSGASTFLNHRVILERDAFIASHLASIKGHSGVLNDRYLWYFLSTVRSQDLKQDNDYPSVNKGDIESIIVQYPPPSEQKRIVAVLDAAFEGLTRAKDNAEANLQNARELFVSCREEAFDAGQNGWSCRRLEELITIKHGFAFKSEFFTSVGDYVLLTPGNYFETGGYRDRGAKQKFYIGEIPDGYVLNEGDLLVAMTEQAEGLLGSCIVVPEPDRFLHNQRLGLIEPKIGVEFYAPFFAEAFNLIEFRKALTRSSTGIKVRHTSPTKIGDEAVPLPLSKYEQIAVAEKLEILRAEIEGAEANYRTKLTDIADLRQSLLQKAFAGELT